MMETRTEDNIDDYPYQFASEKPHLGAAREETSQLKPMPIDDSANLRSMRDILTGSSPENISEPRVHVQHLGDLHDIKLSRTLFLVDPRKISP